MTTFTKLLVTTLQYALGFLVIWYFTYTTVQIMRGVFAGGLENWK